MGGNRSLYVKMPSAARHNVAANQLLSGESGQRASPANIALCPLLAACGGAVGGAQKPWQESVPGMGGAGAAPSFIATSLQGGTQVRSGNNTVTLSLK